MNPRAWNRIFTVFFLVAFVAGMIQPAATMAAPVDKEPAAPATQEDALAKIDPLVMEQIAAEGQTEFFIWMTAKADLSVAKQLNTKLEKGQYVYDTLRATADRNQKALRAELDAQGVEYRPFYISNKIFVYSGSESLVMNLATRSDVAKITPNRQFQLEEPFIDRSAPEHITAIEPNISFIRAPEVWALGITGTGTVMAGNDTGLDWDHPAIINQYRGWDGATADHNYNWWDATGAYPSVPGDGHGHGTHTTGTMVGDDGGDNQIGVAPGAQTIHCKNMTDGGSGSDFTFSTCFEWDLAPWDLNGADPRPDLAPDAINNSWGYWGGGQPQFEDEIAALQAAGIVVEVSAGNEGSSCGSLRSPGDYVQVMTTGSVNHAGGVLPGTLTGFSSRGPSSLYPDDYFPDIMAPGENIRSSVPGGGYQGGWSGTSMSGPHSTALIGLMWSANPAMQGMVEETYNLIYQTAVPLTGVPGSNCGGDYDTGPNNDWGFGTIDAMEAVQAALTFGSPGTLEGFVTDSSTTLPIAGAQITAVHSEGYTFHALTDDTGFYSRVLMEGTYEVTASKYGYLPETETGVVIVEDGVMVLDFALDPAPSFNVHGTVTDAITGWPLYATIEIGGAPIPPVWTDPVSGEYSVTLVAGVEYAFTVNAWVDGYLTEVRLVGPLEEDLEEDIALDVNAATCVAPGYEQELGQLYLEDFESGYGNWSMTGLWNEESESDACGSWVAPFPSPVNAAYYGVDGGVCNFDVGYTTGSLTMLAPVSLPPGEAIFLSFDSYEETECGGNCSYDKRYIEVSDNGGASWTTVIEGYQEYAWNNYWLDISSFQGSDLNVRFRFDSIDSAVNYFFGWMVDDVALYTAACVPTEGSLLVGNVYDANLMVGLNGATVAVEDGDSTSTFATPDDPMLDDGFYTVFAPTGSQTVTASKSGYADHTEVLDIPLFETVEQDFYLNSGILVPDPESFEVSLELGSTLVETLTLSNPGTADVAFEIFEIDRGFIPVGGPAISTLPAAAQPAGPNFSTAAAPAGYQSLFTPGTFAGSNPLAGTVAVFKDLDAWGVNDVEMFLAANGIPYEVHGSGSFGSLDFSEYGMIVISGDQPQSFYDAYATYVSKFEAYVSGGGLLNFYACDSGWNGGTLTAPLPGGMTWTGWMYEEYNTIVDLEHPVVAGVPNPFYGNSASHGHFGNLPAEANVIAVETNGGQPTIVEYPIGGGWLIAFGQPLEISHAWGWDAGLIMENSLLWGYSFQPFVDIPWLSEDPIAGTVLADSWLDIEVTFDVTVIYQPGEYKADLRILNDTPHGPLNVPVTMNATPPADWGKLEGTVTGLGFCDVNPGVLEGALVHIVGQTMIWDVETDEDGYFQIWLPEDESPLTISVTIDEHEDGDAEGVIVSAGETTTVDFDLRWLKPCFSVDPTSLDAILMLGETETQILTLINTGAGDGEFELRERDRGFTPGLQGSIPAQSPVSIPRFEGELPAKTEPLSTGRAPGIGEMVETGTGRNPLSLLGAPAYALDVYPGNTLVMFPDVDVPGSWNVIASVPQFHPAADFLNGDFSKLYALDYDTNQFVTIDTTTGARTVIGTAAGNGEWTGMTGASDGTLYVLSSACGSSSTLYTIDPGTAVLTQIGPVGSGTCIIDIAINAQGEMYGVDIVSDMLYGIDPATGAGTPIGSTGVTANYAQGMDFEEESGILYWASYTTFGAMRIIDTATGASTLVGNFPGNAEVDGLAFATGGVSDVPWLDEDPAAGTVPAGSSLEIEVTFDAGAVTQPGEYLADLIVTNNSPGGSFMLPVSMSVTAPLEYGKLEGTVTGLGFCDLNPAPLKDVEVTVTSAENSWTVETDENGYYILWINEAESPVTVHVEPAEHEMGHADGVQIVGSQTTTVDFDLRWLKPCVGAVEEAFEVTVPAGFTHHETLTLLNDGAGEGSFSIREANGEFIPPAPMGGSGEWLERASTGLLMMSNRDGETLAYPSAYRWTASQPTDAAILVYADDYIHVAPNTFVDQALQLLGLSYTAYYEGNFSGFEAALIGGTWDLVIFANDNYYPDVSTLNALNDFAGAGGMLIAHSWTLSGNPSPLWTTLGVIWYMNDSDPPDPVYWWEADHPVFNDPEQVPEFTQLTPGIYGTYGQHVEPMPGFEALAGYTTSPEANHAAMLIGNENRTIFRGFMDGQNSADLDSDGLLDGVELWINLIEGIQVGFASDIPWLSEDPVEGVIAPDSDLAVDLIFDTTDLELGTYTGLLKISHNNPMGGRIEIPVTMHVVEAAYGLEVNWQASELSGAPGEMATFEAAVTNMGNVPDTFDLTFEDNLWDVVIDPEEISLGAGESAQVSVMVYIPGDAEDGDWDEVTITVVSQGDPEVWHEATLKTTAVVLGDAPVAGFSFAPAAPVAGEEITFTNTTTGTEPIIYEWDFGDGASSTAEHPTHVYAEAGSYVVTLTATNAFGEDTFTETIVVTAVEPPTINIFLPVVIQ